MPEKCFYDEIYYTNTKINKKSIQNLKLKDKEWKKGKKNKEER